jgi:hypothetical protein
MIRHMRFGLLAVGLVAIPIIASAQTRIAPAVRSAWHPMPMARPPAARPAATPAHPIIVRLPASTTRQGQTSAAATNALDFSVFPNGTFGFLPSTATSFDLNQLLNNVPGFGFDYTHLAALQGNLGEKAFIDPVTQQDIALAEQLSRSTPAFDDGFIPFWGGYGYSEPAVEEEPQQQPQVIVLQQPVPVSRSESAPSAEAAPAEQESPLPDVGEFTLVLRDGSKIKAVAFTHQNDQIVYITSDGVRDSFPVSDLDVTATQQLNQQHGTPLHLSL